MTPSFVTEPVTVPEPVRVVPIRSPAGPGSNRALAVVSRIALLRRRVAPSLGAGVPLVPVVAPPYVTALPVSVVVAAPDWVNEPRPLIRDSATGFLVFRTTNEPLFTTL